MDIAINCDNVPLNGSGNFFHLAMSRIYGLVKIKENVTLILYEDPQGPFPCLIPGSVKDINYLIDEAEPVVSWGLEETLFMVYNK